MSELSYNFKTGEMKDLKEPTMKKIIILLIAVVISPSLVNADHHTIPGIGQGAFNTLMVKAKDINKYVDTLRSDQTVFKAIGATDAGVCVTRSGNNHKGEMFVWTAYPDVASAINANDLYNPAEAPESMSKLRKVKYGVTWKGLKSFRLDPGWERVLRVKVSPENLNAFVDNMRKLETAIIESGHETFNLGVFMPIGGGVHESSTIMVRAISPTAEEIGHLIDEYFEGADWAQYWQQSAPIMELVSDTFELCEQIYKAE